MVKVNQGDTVMITWTDHSGGTANWGSLEDFVEESPAYKIKTVGFVTNFGKSRITVVQSWAVNDLVNHHMTIERKLITEIKVLRKCK